MRKDICKGRGDFTFHKLIPYSPSFFHFGNFESHPQQPNLLVVSTSNLGLPDQAHWIIGPKVNSLRKNTNRLWLEVCLWRGLKSPNLKCRELWILGEIKNGSTVQYNSDINEPELGEILQVLWHSPYKTTLQRPATSLGIPRLPALWLTG